MRLVKYQLFLLFIAIFLLPTLAHASVGFVKPSGVDTVGSVVDDTALTAKLYVHGYSGGSYVKDTGCTPPLMLRPIFRPLAFLIKTARAFTCSPGELVFAYSLTNTRTLSLESVNTWTSSNFTYSENPNNTDDTVRHNWTFSKTSGISVSALPRCFYGIGWYGCNNQGPCNSQASTLSPPLGSIQVKKCSSIAVNVLPSGVKTTWTVSSPGAWDKNNKFPITGYTYNDPQSPLPIGTYSIIGIGAVSGYGTPTVTGSQTCVDGGSKTFTITFVANPSGPGAFTLNAITCNASGQQVLTWTNSSGATSYDVYRRRGSDTTPIPSSSLLYDTNAVSGWKDVGSNPGVWYDYVVRARNASGFTDSNMVSKPCGSLPPNQVTCAQDNSIINVGDYVTYSATTGDDTKAYNWTFAGGTPGSTNNDKTPPPVSYIGAGTWTATVVNGATTDTCTVTVNAAPLTVTIKSPVGVTVPSGTNIKWLATIKGNHGSKTQIELECDTTNGGSWDFPPSGTLLLNGSETPPWTYSFPDCTYTATGQKAKVKAINQDDTTVNDTDTQVVTIGNLPDLAVTEPLATPNPTSASTGTAITFAATVKNLSTLQSAAVTTTELTILDSSGSPVAGATVDKGTNALAKSGQAGSSQALSFSWIPGPTFNGTYSYRICANALATDNVLESDHDETSTDTSTNNCAAGSTFTVISPPTIQEINLVVPNFCASGTTQVKWVSTPSADDNPPDGYYRIQVDKKNNGFSNCPSGILDPTPLPSNTNCVDTGPMINSGNDSAILSTGTDLDTGNAKAWLRLNIWSGTTYPDASTLSSGWDKNIFSCTYTDGTPCGQGSGFTVPQTDNTGPYMSWSIIPPVVVGTSVTINDLTNIIGATEWDWIFDSPYNAISPEWTICSGNGGSCNVKNALNGNTTHIYTKASTKPPGTFTLNLTVKIGASKTCTYTAPIKVKPLKPRWFEVLPK